MKEQADFVNLVNFLRFRKLNFKSVPLKNINIRQSLKKLVLKNRASGKLLNGNVKQTFAFSTKKSTWKTNLAPSHGVDTSKSFGQFKAVNVINCRYRQESWSQIPVQRFWWDRVHAFHPISFQKRSLGGLFRWLSTWPTSSFSSNELISTHLQYHAVFPRLASVWLVWKNVWMMVA